MMTSGAASSGEFAARAKVSLAALIAAACSFHFRQGHFAFAGRFGDAGPGAEQPPVINTARDRRGRPAQIA
jgi:hypothetical protein